MPKGIRKGQKKLSEEERIARRKASWKKFREKNIDRLLAKARERYAANSEKEKDRHKEWATKNVKHLREYLNRRYAENPETKKKQTRNWRKKNPEYSPMACKRWVKNNPRKARESQRLSNQMRRNASGSFSTNDMHDIRRMQKSCCAYCKKHLKFHQECIDHIIALANGGTHNRCNLQILCRSCNSRKWARDPIEFVRSEYGFLV